MLKWIGLCVVMLALIGFGYTMYKRDDMNARVAAEIRSDPDGERARLTMLLTLADGRLYPVNYLREENLVFVGVDGRWWREFEGSGQPVTMLIRGEELSGNAVTVLDDPEYTADVFARLRPKVPGWLPTWLNGKLVVITLDTPAA